VYGALVSIDASDMDDTIDNLIADRIRASVIGLSAQVAICAKLCSRTNDGDTSSYSIALHEQHFRELLLAATTPPVTRTLEQSSASLLLMGFPSRTIAAPDRISLCGCHHRPSREGYACPRCKIKVCRLPAECPVCGLTLVMSTHLARSYHHLFPLRTWVEVSWAEAARSVACYACHAPFPPVPKNKLKGKGQASVGGVSEVKEAKGVSESGRYACQACGNHFCIDCDVYSHETLHNCPGCQGDTRASAAAAAAAAAEANGDAHANGTATAMEVDS